MGRLISLFGFAAVSALGGIALAVVIASFFFETPLLLSRSVYLMLCVAHGQQFPGLGGMETVGLLCLVTTSVVSVGIAVLLGAALLRPSARTAPAYRGVPQRGGLPRPAHAWHAHSARIVSKL